jgi:RNA polymerase sigma factor (sigma-70 family)
MGYLTVFNKKINQEALKKASKKSERTKVREIQLTSPAKEEKNALSATRLSEAKKQEMVLEFRVKARKLSRSMLRRWQSRLDMEELDSIVDLSLCEAVKHFDPSRGVSFITFLFYHLKGNLVRAVSAAASEGAIARNIDPLDGEELVALTANKNVNAQEVAEALNGQEQALPYDLLLKKEMAKLSRDSRSKLDPVEKEVIERIFIQGQQLIDIASNLGYSRCHISRLKKKALDFLESDLKAKMEISEKPGAKSSALKGSDASRSKFSFASRQRRAPRRFKLPVAEYAKAFSEAEVAC